MPGTSIGPSGVTFPDGSVQASSAGFVAGTAMLFKQTAAPTGWTKDTTNNNDAALRVVTGTAGTGGSTAFSSVFASRTPSGSLSSTTATNQNTTVTGSVGVSGSVGNTTLDTNTMPSHNHTLDDNANGTSGSGTSSGQTRVAYGDNYWLHVDWVNTKYRGGSAAHGHSFSGSGSFTGNAHSHTQDAHSHTFTGSAMDFAVKYVDLIIATKN